MIPEEHHWEGIEPDPDNYFGFTYCITNNITGKQYIGMKFYHNYSRGKKKHQTNWRCYTGSCKPLNADIDELGKDNFTFTMLKQYKTRGGLKNGEANAQHKLDVLTATLEDGTPAFYNGNIMAVKWRVTEHTQETRDLLSAVMKGKNKGANNGMYNVKGREHPSYDHKIYKFKHIKTKEEFIGTQYDFRMKYNLSDSKVPLLIKGGRKTHMGWEFIGEVLDE